MAPISDLVYNSDLSLPKCGCGQSCGPDHHPEHEPVTYIMPPPPPAIDVCRFPYPPVYPWPYPVPPCPPGPGPAPTPDPDQNATEKAICKLSHKAATVRQLIENLEEKNKALIVKSGAASYQLGVLKTPDPEDEAAEIINENVQTVIDILKAELEKIKEEIKELSDKLVED